MLWKKQSVHCCRWTVKYVGEGALEICNSYMLPSVHIVMLKDLTFYGRFLSSPLLQRMFFVPWGYAVKAPKHMV